MFNALHFPYFTAAELEILSKAEGDHQQRLKKNQNWELFNKYHEDMGEHHRRQLIAHFHIGTDDFGHYNFISPEDYNHLLGDTYTQLAQAITTQAELNAQYGVSDDGLDYMKATALQLNWLHEAFSDESGPDHGIPAFLKMLNSIHLDPAGDDDCWRYGFADHTTIISDLMRINHDMED